MLVPLAEDLWIVDHRLRLGGVEFGTRTSVVRLDGGELLLHAPGPLDDATRKTLAEIGPVAHLLAPNKLHHLSFGAAAAHYPEARRWLAPGLAEKRPGLPRGTPLTPGAALPFADQLRPRFIEGWTYANETVFLHAASRTLLLTDLVFNFPARPGVEGLMLRLMGAHDRFGPSRLARLTMRDPATLRPSIAAVLEWDFDRVVPTHGSVLEQGGQECLRESFTD